MPERHIILLLALILAAGCGSDSGGPTYFSAVIENNTDSTIIIRYDYECFLLSCDYYKDTSLAAGATGYLEWYQDGDQRFSVPLEIEYNGIKIEKRVYPSDYTGPDIISVNNSDF